MKKYTNLIFSCISLVVTAALLVVTIFSWYVTNTKATASGITAVTASNEHSFKIQYWDASSSETDKWEDTTNFDTVTKDLWPSDIVYFRIILLDEDTSVDVDVSLSDVSVTLDSTQVTSDGSTVSYNGVSMYTVTDGAVTVEVGSTNYTLYNVTQDTEDTTKYVISLDDLLITSGVRIDNNPTMSSGVPVGLRTTDITNLSVLDGTFLSHVTITDEAPLYFALYYADGTYTKQTITEFAADTTYYTYTVANGYKKASTYVSGTTYYTKSSNSITNFVDYFQYQKLKIASVRITTV